MPVGCRPEPKGGSETSTCHFHPHVPATYKCHKCGTPLCHDCRFQEQIGSHVTAYSSIDSVVQIEYGIYCPSCFIALSREKGYDKESPATKWAIITIVSLFLMVVFIASGNFGLQIASVMLFVVVFIGVIQYLSARAVYNRGRNQYITAMQRMGAPPGAFYQPQPQMASAPPPAPPQRQLMVGAGPYMAQPGPAVAMPVAAPPPAATPPSAPAPQWKVNFCSSCGSRLSQDSAFCSACGNKVQ